MAKRRRDIQSVFNKWLGGEARRLAAEGAIKIIEHRDFPEGAPLHEDGSTEYDPRKPLVLFAVLLDTPEAFQAWGDVVREFERLRAEDAAA